MRFYLLIVFFLSMWFWLYLKATIEIALGMTFIILLFAAVMYNATNDSCSFTEEDLKDLLEEEDDDEDDSEHKSAH